MSIAMDAREFVVELVTQLFHADVLITEQAERIEFLEAEVGRLRAAPPGHRRQRASGKGRGEGGEEWGRSAGWPRPVGEWGSGGRQKAAHGGHPHDPRNAGPDHPRTQRLR
jgi:hypothetical protein